MSFLDRGHQAVRAGDLKRAQEEYRKGIEAGQDVGEQHRFLASLLMEKAHWDAAVPHLREAILRGEDNTATRGNLARALSKLGDAEAALQEATIAVQMEPDALAVRHVLIDVLVEQGRLVEAIEAVNSAEQAAGTSPLLLQQGAQAAIALGNAQQAREFYRRAIALCEPETSRRQALVEALESLQATSTQETNGHNKTQK